MGYSNCYSQNRKGVDSLVEVLDRIKFAEPDKVLKISGELLNKNVSDKNRAYIYRSMGYAFMVKGNVKQQQMCFEKAYDFAIKSGDTFCRTKISCSLAEAYVWLNLYTEAEDYLMKALKDSEGLKDSGENLELKTTINALLGNIYYFKDNNDESIKIFHKNLLLSKKITNQSFYYKVVSYTYLGLGNNYLKINEPDSANYYYTKGLSQSLKSPEKINLYYQYLGLADVCIVQKEYGKAIDYYQKCLLLKNIPEYVKANVFKKMSETYVQMNDTGNARKFADSSQLYAIKTERDKGKALELAVNKIRKDKTAIIAGKDRDLTILYKILAVILLMFVLSTTFYFLDVRKQKKKYLKFVGEQKTKEPVSGTEAAANHFSVGKPAINSEIEREILQNLKKFENNEGFRNKELSLSVLASDLNTNTNYLSRIINQHYGKNFNNYISDLRIGYIIKKINENSDYQKYKISFLAEDAGFVSHSAFSTKFKEITGVSPSNFMNFSARKS